MSVSAITDRARLAHMTLLVSIAETRPHIIKGDADSCDVAERIEHFDALARAVSTYVVTVMDELGLSEGNGIDFTPGLSDLMGDTILGPLQRAIERLREEEDARSERRGSARASESMEA